MRITCARARWPFTCQDQVYLVPFTSDSFNMPDNAWIYSPPPTNGETEGKRDVAFVDAKTVSNDFASHVLSGNYERVIKDAAKLGQYIRPNEDQPAEGFDHRLTTLWYGIACVSLGDEQMKDPTSCKTEAKHLRSQGGRHIFSTLCVIPSRDSSRIDSNPEEKARFDAALPLAIKEIKDVFIERHNVPRLIFIALRFKSWRVNVAVDLLRAASPTADDGLTLDTDDDKILAKCLLSACLARSSPPVAYDGFMTVIMKKEGGLPEPTPVQYRDIGEWMFRPDREELLTPATKIAVASLIKGAVFVMMDNDKWDEVFIRECPWCLETEALKRCGCHKVKYCSQDCQKAHWKAGHKQVCDVRKKKKK